MTVADRIAAKVAALRPRYEDVALPDWCEVVRPVSTADGRGGLTDVPTVVEVTRCALDVSNRAGVEGTGGDVLAARSVYTCELPYGSLLTERDALRVNGREFTVVDVGWGEGFEIGLHATLEERS